jgi:hypothetical protein
MQPTLKHATLATVHLPLLSVAFTVHAKTAGEVYEQAARSTVVVENIDAKGKAQGMGSDDVLPDGDVVTNCHVVLGDIRPRNVWWKTATQSILVTRELILPS